MVDPLKNKQFSYCQDFVGLGVFFPRNSLVSLLWYAVTIQTQKTYVGRLEVVCKDLEEKINDFERGIKLEEKSWHAEGLAIDKFKKALDDCTERLVRMIPRVDFKHDSEYFADLQCIYNEQAKWLKLRDGRILAQEKRKGAGGLSDDLIEKYEKLAEQKKALALARERLESAKHELFSLEAERTDLQAAVSRRVAMIKDVSFADKMCGDDSYKDFGFTR